VGIGKEIHEAIERSEFVPYFQPLVELRTGKVEAFEILARWQHPTRGLILPNDFITEVERLGVMNGLTTSIFAQALEAAKTIPESIGFSLNISPFQILDPSLPALIARLADDENFDLRRLTVEITESALVDDVDLAGEVVVKLKSMGIRLSLDDFGTGYSSLLHLQSLPFDELKIDRSFVNSMTTHNQSRKITAAVIGLGQNLGLRTVAEGIEQAAQAELLIWHGCKLGQGWLYGHPAPADSLPLMLTNADCGIAAQHNASPDVTTIAGALDTNPAARLPLLRAIYDSAPIGLAFLDCELRYLCINQQLADLNGRPIQEHLGRTVAEIHPKLFPLWEPYLRRALAGEALLGVELERPSLEPGAPMMYNLASYQPAFDETGEVIGLSITVVDITSIKQKDTALIDRTIRDNFTSSKGRTKLPN
jgi:EAL domain-containing protein (putative c-di-GMP-specific phosphodiesterase class I)